MRQKTANIIAWAVFIFIVLGAAFPVIVGPVLWTAAAAFVVFLVVAAFINGGER